MTAGDVGRMISARVAEMNVGEHPVTAAQRSGFGSKAVKSSGGMVQQLTPHVPQGRQRTPTEVYQRKQAPKDITAEGMEGDLHAKD